MSLEHRLLSRNPSQSVEPTNPESVIGRSCQQLDAAREASQTRLLPHGGLRAFTRSFGRSCQQSGFGRSCQQHGASCQRQAKAVIRPARAVRYCRSCSQPQCGARGFSDASPATRWATRVSIPLESARYMTKFAPNNALQLIACRQVDFCARVVQFSI